MAVLSISEALDRVNAELARRSLREFIKQAWHVVEPATEYVHGWHIDAIADHLEAVTRGEIKNLLVNMPPRCMKSSIISVMWPCWVWTHSPSVQWLFSSYAMQLALRDSLKCRRIIESPWYSRNYSDIFTLTSDQNAKGRFENDKRGYRLSTSVDSGVTGEGGQIIVSDDPHNVREAESAAVREATLEWWDQAMSTRLNDPKTGCKVIVMQRVHGADLSGHVLEQGGYEHLCLPMEYEPGRHCFTSIWQDPRKEEGELLWPERFGPDEVARLKKVLGGYGFAGQCQQSPVPRAGGTFKREWLRYFTEEGDYYILHTPDGDRPVAKNACQIFATNDPAISTKQESDYTVIQIWAMTPKRELLLLAQVRGHLDNPQQVQAIEQQYLRWTWDYIAVETVFYALALYQQLKAKGIPVKEYRPVRDKVARASVAAIKMEAGDIYFLQNADYLPELESEVLKFPRDAHDDQVDPMAMAADLSTSYGIPLSGEPMPEERVINIEEHIRQAQQNPFEYAGWDD